MPDHDHWITSVTSVGGLTALDCIDMLVGKQKIFAFPKHKNLQAGDWICFYAKGVGVVAHARLKTQPLKGTCSDLPDPQEFPWIVKLVRAAIYTHKPTRLTQEKREELDAFHKRDSEANWGWFVWSTHRITKRDFHLLTTQMSHGSPWTLRSVLCRGEYLTAECPEEHSQAHEVLVYVTHRRIPVLLPVMMRVEFA